jgi:DNA-binding XRE family transcriptional regulator
MTLLAGPLKVNLAERRVNAGHTLRSLAREIGVAATTLTRAENGDTVTPQVAHAVAGFHGLTVTDVWSLDAPECRRASCTDPAVRAGLCLSHHEQRLDHARDAEAEL